MDEIRRWLGIVPPWIFSAICLAVILWLTLAPKPLGDNPPQLFPGADKVVHAIMFGGFTWAIMLDYQRRHRWRPVGFPVMAIAALISFSLGVIIEFAQDAMGLGRGYDAADIVADGCGCIAFPFIWTLIQPYWMISGPAAYKRHKRKRKIGR